MTTIGVSVAATIFCVSVVKNQVVSSARATDQARSAILLLPTDGCWCWSVERSWHDFRNYVSRWRPVVEAQQRTRRVVGINPDCEGGSCVLSARANSDTATCEQNGISYHQHKNKFFHPVDVPQSRSKSFLHRSLRTACDISCCPHARVVLPPSFWQTRHECNGKSVQRRVTLSRCREKGCTPRVRVCAQNVAQGGNFTVSSRWNLGAVQKSWRPRSPVCCIFEIFVMFWDFVNFFLKILESLLYPENRL